MLTIHKSLEYKNGAAIVVDALNSFGIKQIFGYPGASVLSLYNELADNTYIKHCLCRHEQACVHAAEGYARISGEIGVVLVTSGPGATNTVTGIADAYADCTPLLVIAGAPNETDGKIFQNVDFVSMIKPVVKSVFNPSLKDDLYETISAAINLACFGKKGPVVVQLKREILEKVYKFNNDKKITLQEQVFSPDISVLISLLNSSKYPLLLVGGGCLDSFDKVSALAEKFSINTVSTLTGVGNISSKSSFYNGMIGINGTDEANNLVYKSDLIIAIGTAFSDRTTCKSEKFANGVPVININIEPCKHKNVNVVMEINADCSIVLDKLLDIPFKNNHFYTKKITSDNNSNSIHDNKMHTCEVLECINSFIKLKSPIIITDVGQHQMLAAQNFSFTKPKRFLTSGGMGTMGFGLPAACGAHFAEPDACIINITGDGSFQMNIQELATVREYNIPVKIFVMNNGYLGMIRQTQEKLYNGKYYQSKMNNPDFITLAKGYDIKGYRVNTIDQLRDVLPKIFNNNNPIIVDCITSEIESV